MVITIVTWFGIGVTIVSAILGIIYSRKKNWQRKITFLMKRPKFYSSIAQENPAISIVLKGEKDNKESFDIKINGDIVVINGTLKNIGQIDIPCSTADSAITVLLLEGYKWIQVEIEKASPNLEASIKLKDDKRSLIVEHRLFREREYIDIKAFIEIPFNSCKGKDITSWESGKKILDTIQFSHRIENTGRIKKVLTSNTINKIWDFFYTF